MGEKKKSCKKAKMDLTCQRDPYSLLLIIPPTFDLKN